METAVVATNGSAEKAKVVEETAVALVVPETSSLIPAGLNVKFHELAKVIIAGTMLANRLNFIATEEENEKLSKKAKKIQKYIEKSDFNCRRQTVAGLMSLLLDEKIRVHDDDEQARLRWVGGAVYVPTARYDSHCYPLGEPFIHMDGRRGLILNGNEGDNCSPFVKHYRAVVREDLLKVFTSERLMENAATNLKI